MRWQAIRRLLSGSILLTALAVSGLITTPSLITAQTGPSNLLTPTELQKQFPATVYYDGQSAPAQLRNSGGVKFADGHFVLMSLVDNSGYSTGVASKYQGYLIAEVALEIEGKRIPAGAYGFGFLEGKFVVTDLGGYDVLAVHTANDQVMRRPRPLQVTADPAGGFRLYSGRNYVRFMR
jgi:hypothetical protein